MFTIKSIHFYNTRDLFILKLHQCLLLGRWHLYYFTITPLCLLQNDKPQITINVPIAVNTENLNV